MSNNLPPGVTSSDIEKQFGLDSCPNCGRVPWKHKLGCPLHPESAELCSVCNPPGKNTFPEYRLPVFCDKHDIEDLRAIQNSRRAPIDEALAERFKDGFEK